MSEILVCNCFPVLRGTSIVHTFGVETIGTIVNSASTVLAKIEDEGKVLEVWKKKLVVKVKGRLRRSKVSMMTTISISSTLMTLTTVITVITMLTVTTNVRSMTVKTK